MVDPEQFKDPRWRIANLYKIVNKDGKVVQFVPNWAQEEFLDDIHSRNLILKARQLGMTTVACIAYLDDCLFNDNVAASVIADKLDNAKKIFATKVKFPYDNLPDQLKARRPLTRDSADTLVFNNGSSIQVSTSTRSATVQWLHVSEYGKICAQFPEKAREIRTGAFPSAERGTITIESTAEGEGGDFYERCMRALEINTEGRQLERTEERFFFFPWWKEPSYEQLRSTVTVSPDDLIYFARLEQETGLTITDEKINWWMAQELNLAGDMKREYPATPKEAFEQALEGAIFSDQIAGAYKHQRIGSFPIDPMRLVHTFWDLGFSDETAIWLMQDHGQQGHMVAYYENSGEGIEHYLQWLKDWGSDNNATFGNHYMPHDADRRSIWTPEGTLAVMGKLGFRPQVVSRTADKWEQVRTGRRRFQQLCFDAESCKTGLIHLKRYRKEWDEKRGVWRQKPFHGPESNGADALLTWAQSNHTPTKPTVRERSDRYRSRSDVDDAPSAWVI